MEAQKQGNVKRIIVNRYGMIPKKDINVEINLMRWNDGPKKLDIRMWTTDGRYPYKGITLNREEFYAFMDILTHIDPMVVDSKNYSGSKTEGRSDRQKSAEENTVPMQHQEYNEYDASEHNLTKDTADNASEDIQNGNYESYYDLPTEDEMRANEYVDFTDENSPDDNLHEHAS